MGSYPRSYGPRFNWGGLLTPAIRALIIITSAVFLVQTLAALFSPEAARVLIRWFGLVPRAVTHGLRLWQPFTYLFLHGGIWHILINLLFLWMFGSDLERLWGRRKFLFYYFLTGVGAGLTNIIVKTLLDPGGHGSSMVATIGASGAIYGILLACAVLFPDRQVWLIPLPVTLPMRVFVLIMGAIEFFSTLSATGDNVSHVTHLGGILAGYLYLRRGSFFYGLRNHYLDWKRRQTRRKFEVYMRHHKEEPPSRPDRWIN